jgi:hypothetical protein
MSPAPSWRQQPPASRRQCHDGIILTARGRHKGEAGCENGRMRLRESPRPGQGSAGSILSIGSSGSILSIGSAGSILSIGSAGSILSIGSAASFGCVLSAGSFASVGSVLSGLSRWSVLAWRSRRRTAPGLPQASETRPQGAAR